MQKVVDYVNGPTFVPAFIRHALSGVGGMSIMGGLASNGTAWFVLGAVLFLLAVVLSFVQKAAQTRVAQALQATETALDNLVRGREGAKK